MFISSLWQALNLGRGVENLKNGMIYSLILLRALSSEGEEDQNNKFTETQRLIGGTTKRQHMKGILREAHGRDSRRKHSK